MEEPKIELRQWSVRMQEAEYEAIRAQQMKMQDELHRMVHGTPLHLGEARWEEVRRPAQLVVYEEMMSDEQRRAVIVSLTARE